MNMTLPLHKMYLTGYMSNETPTTQSGIAILPDGYKIINYDFPPTNCQAAPVPTEDTEECACGAATAISMSSGERFAMVPGSGELILDTTLHMLFVGDGTTAEGIMVEGGGSGGDFTSVTFWQSATI